MLFHAIIEISASYRALLNHRHLCYNENSIIVGCSSDAPYEILLELIPYWGSEPSVPVVIKW